MSIVREPKNQYQFKEKQEYREAVWDTFASNLDASNAKVLFFPGRHGLEIEVALERGFREENLIACEENAAILATAAWHKQYPQIRCYGTKLSRTIERLAADGIIVDAANLDYCSNLCTSVMDDFRKLLTYKITKPTIVLAVTLLKGREDRTVTDIARLVFKEATGALDRIGLVQSLLSSWRYPTKLLSKSQYRSNTKNMVYGILVVATEDWMSNQYLQFFESHLAEVDALMGLDDKVTDPQAFETYKVLQDEFFDRRNILKNKLLEFDRNFYGFTNHSYFLSWKWHRLFDIGNRRHRDDYRQELTRTRKQLIRSESEKAQILQAGRAYR